MKAIFLVVLAFIGIALSTPVISPTTQGYILPSGTPFSLNVVCRDFDHGHDVTGLTIQSGLQTGMTFVDNPSCYPTTEGMCKTLSWTPSTPRRVNVVVRCTCVGETGIAEEDLETYTLVVSA